MHEPEGDDSAVWHPLCIRARLDRTHGGLPMSADMILAGTQFVGLVLSFTLLHRARRFSVRLWSTKHFHPGLPTGSDVMQPAEIDQIFRTQERQT